MRSFWTADFAQNSETVQDLYLWTGCQNWEQHLELNWVQILAPSFLSGVTIGKLLNLSVPQFKQGRIKQAPLCYCK